MNLKILKKLPVILVAIMIMATVGVTGVSADGQDIYGSQVEICEVDDTYILTPLPANIRWINNGGAPGPDWGDSVYLNVDGAGITVALNDVRLTVVQAGGVTYPAGSQVQALDNDISLVTQVAAGRHLRYANIVTAAGYNLGDPIFWKFGVPVAVNDLRISNYISFNMGDFVGGTDTDLTAATFAIPQNFAFYDVDGNGVYEFGDHVLVDVDGDGLGTVNDIRLTPFDACGAVYQEGTKITQSRLDSVHTLTPQVFTIRYADLTGNLYSADDPVYLDRTNNGLVNVLDVRLTTVAGNGPGTLVWTGEADLGDALLIPGTGAIVRFQDLTGDGYSLDDPVLIDMEPNGFISTNDVILSEGLPSSGIGTPGTKILSGTVLPLNNMPAFTQYAYYDTDGAGLYSYGDYIFLDVGGLSSSRVNNVRLTEPTFSYSFGTKVGPTDSCSVDVLTGIGISLVSWDITNNGFSIEDPVYLRTTGSLSVGENYIRLTPLNHGGQSFRLIGYDIMI